MRFTEKTHCKLSVSNNSTTAFSTYKSRNIILLTLDLDADFSCCSWM